jgi:hypothetical protein
MNFVRPKYIFVFLAIATVICLAYRNSVRASGLTVKGDTRSSSSEWNDFYHSSVVEFQPNTGYKISFNYKVLSTSKGAGFYVVINDNSQNRTFDWEQWTGKVGHTGEIQKEFIDRDKHNYTLVIGIQNRASVLIQNLKILADPRLKPLVIGYPVANRTWTSRGNATYYIDSTSGNDSNSGANLSRPWRTLANLNTGVLEPGDRILLRAGSHWYGCLAPSGQGTAKAPITIDSYGSGAKPIIDAQEKWLSALYLYNTSHVHVRNLELTNLGPENQPDLTGVKISELNYGVAHDITLDDLYVHDVAGSELKTEGTQGGIDCSCWGDTRPTCFDGLTIENCRLVRTDRNGITINGAFERNVWFPNHHVIIRNNRLDDIGGDGIVPIGCDGALIEHNILRGARMRTSELAAGIWPWSCDNTTVQYNDVSGLHGTKDGEGFDSDYNCQHSVFQYNYSHDNDGGFMLICDRGDQPLPDNIGNIGTIVRYNVSVDDKLYTFSISGRDAKTQIYNNTIYLGAGSAARVLNGGEWGGWPNGVQFTNNVLFTTHKADFFFGNMTNTSFNRNDFSGPFVNAPNDKLGLHYNPRFVNQGGKLPEDYRPARRSPLIDEGASVPDNGNHDFADEPVPQYGRPTIGAFQK